MKDKYKIILIAALLIIALLLTTIKTKKEETQNFKEEYEKLNNQTNNQGKEYPTVNIDKENIIKYATYNEIKEILTNKSGIIYFGFPECPWCRNIIEPLLLSAQKENIETIYYFNAYSIRDKKHLDENGKIIIDEKGTEEYQELINIMKDYLTPYEGLNDENIKRLYFPTVVFIKDGQIKDIHIGTLESQTDPYTPLTDKQKEELISIYIKGIKKIQSTACTDKC